MSIPIQHTARYIKYHEAELSASDIEIIDCVFNYDNQAYESLKYNYDPLRPEMLVETYKNPSIDELKDYFKVCLNQWKNESNKESWREQRNSF